MPNIYQLSRTLHRWLVLLVVTLGGFMAFTGLMLKYTFAATKILPFMDLGLVRYLHNQLSGAFSIVLGLMALTGLVMYIYPAWVRRKNDAARPAPSPTSGGAGASPSSVIR